MGYIKNNLLASVDTSENDLRYCLNWESDSFVKINYLGFTALDDRDCTKGYEYSRARSTSDIEEVTREYCQFYCDEDKSETLYRFTFLNEGSFDGGSIPETCLIDGTPLVPGDWRCLEEWCKYGEGLPGQCPFGAIQINNVVKRKQCFPTKQSAETFASFWYSTLFTNTPTILRFEDPVAKARFDTMLRDIHSCLCKAISERNEIKLRKYLEFLDFDKTMMLCKMRAGFECEGLFSADNLDEYTACYDSTLISCIADKYRELVLDNCD